MACARSSAVAVGAFAFLSKVRSVERWARLRAVWDSALAMSPIDCNEPLPSASDGIEEAPETATLPGETGYTPLLPPGESQSLHRPQNTDGAEAM
jgi:hypothetical protein